MVLMNQIVAHQQKFFQSNATKNIAFRIEQLKKLERVLKENEHLLNTAIFSDFKKSEFDNYTTELGIIYSEINTACKKLHTWARTKKVTTNFLNFPGKSYITPEPLGVTLIIGAWNYPYQLSLSPAIAAIAAGNTVILKPSEISVATSALLAQIINNTFDPAIFKVVEGGVPETTELLNQKFDKIFFTGSTTIGKIVYKAAAKNLTPVTLELGGKSPVIIDKTCNLKICIKRLVWAKFINAGQTCIAPDYLLVHHSIKNELMEEIHSAWNKMYGSPVLNSSNYPKIIHQKHFDRLIGLMDRSKIKYGGESNANTLQIEPTILSDITTKDAVMQEEIFGPILPVISFENIDEAIKIIDEFEKPLALYYYGDSNQAKSVLNKTSSGGACINDAMMHVANPKLPFGGVGHSGYGAYHGYESFLCFSHRKAVVTTPTWIDLPFKYVPFKGFKWLKKFMT